MKDEDVEWQIWISLVYTFLASVSVSSGVDTHTHTLTNTPFTMFFLVIEALREDGMPGFPGPSNEL